jgi:hypothetical protein
MQHLTGQSEVALRIASRKPVRSGLEGAQRMWRDLGVEQWQKMCDAGVNLKSTSIKIPHRTRGISGISVYGRSKVCFGFGVWFQGSG